MVAVKMVHDTWNSVRLSQCKASYEKLGRNGITVDSTYGVMGRHVQTRAVHPHLIQKSLFATRGCDTCSSTALGFLSPLFIWVWVLVTSRNLKKSAKLVRLNSVAPHSQHLARTFEKKEYVFENSRPGASVPSSNLGHTICADTPDLSWRRLSNKVALFVWAANDSLW